MNRVDVREFSKRELQSAMAEANQHKLSSLSDHKEKILTALKHGRSLTGLKTPWDSLNSKFRLSKGLSILGGINGHFKSTIASQLMLNIAKHHKAGLISLEMEISDIAEVLGMQASNSQVKPTSEFMEQTFLPWSEDRIFVYDHIGSINPMEALGAVDAMLQEQCRFVILDSMMMTRVMDDHDKEREFTQALVGLARLYGANICLVHHSKKLDTSDDMPPQRSDLRGSGNIVDVAAQAIVVWHNKRKSYLKNRIADGHEPDAKEKKYLKTAADLKFIVIKNRHSAHEGVTDLIQKGLNFWDNQKGSFSFE